MKITCLKYGNTNTYLVGNLLIDTDMAGTMPAFRRELKRQGIPFEEIRYVFATHYHPDHMGLIGELIGSGVTLLLPEHQRAYVHFSDAIFARDKRSGFVPIDERGAIVFPAAGSRSLLFELLGLAGEIVPTKSHSPDGAALVLDDRNAFVGDLEPLAYLNAYEENAALREDWEKIFSLGAVTVHSGHISDSRIGE